MTSLTRKRRSDRPEVPAASKGDEEKRQSLARRRMMIVAEIMATEGTYHRHLKLMADYFEIPLRAQKILPNSTISVIFGNIQQLIQVNNELRLHLEEMEVGSAFLQMGPFLKLYSVYAKNHQLAITTLQEMETKDPSLLGFRERQEARPEVQMKLNALLITPVQRVPRYKLLLDELLACTPNTHQDYAALKKAAKHISTVATHINDHIKEHENFQKMVDIQKSLEGSRAPKIVAPGRRFIREGILKRMSRNGGRSYERMFFLFSDMVMYAKPKLVDNGNRHHSCCCVLPLHHCSVEKMFGGSSSKNASPMTPDDRGAMFKLACKDENLLLFSDNKDTVNDWMKVLQDAIGEVKQSRQTLRKESSAKRPMRKSALQRQWRKDKMKKMRDDIKAADESQILVPLEAKSKPKTPASSRRENQIMLKYRQILLNGDSLCCTPKKRLKLEKDEKRPTVPPAEDSFELIDASEMDEFNVTLPRFFKQMSHLNLPDADTTQTTCTSTSISYSTREEPSNMSRLTLRNSMSGPQACCADVTCNEDVKCASAVATMEIDSRHICSDVTNNEVVKCTTAVAAMKHVKNSRCGRTIHGTVKTLGHMRKKIRLPLTRLRSKSETSETTSVEFCHQQSTVEEPNNKENTALPVDPYEQEVSFPFLPPPELSLAPRSLNTAPMYAWDNLDNHQSLAPQPTKSLRSRSTQGVAGQNHFESDEKTNLQVDRVNDRKSLPAQSLKGTQVLQAKNRKSLPAGRMSSFKSSFQEKNRISLPSQGMNYGKSGSKTSLRSNSFKGFHMRRKNSYRVPNRNSSQSSGINRLKPSSTTTLNSEGPMSMNYIDPVTLRSFTKLEPCQESEVIAEDSPDRLSYYGKFPQLPQRKRQIQSMENNFYSLPPALANECTDSKPPARSTSCTERLWVVPDQPLLKDEIHAGEKIMGSQLQDQLPTSTTSEKEMNKKSCTIL